MGTRQALTAPLNIQQLLAAKQMGLGDYIAQAEMKSRTPSLRERIGNLIYDAAQGAGLRQSAQSMRSNAETAVDFVPGLGAAVGGEEAGRDLGSGNYMSGGVGLAMSMVPGAKGLKEGAERLMQKARERGVDLVLSAPHGRLVVDKIVVPKEMRGQGVGSSVIQEVTQFADELGVPLSLDPSTDFGGKSKAALERFYSRHGFESNLGRKRDFEISQAMRRYPKK
jgi:GNAT superfamily N-acetyltransferase